MSHVHKSILATDLDIEEERVGPFGQWTAMKTDTTTSTMTVKWIVKWK